MPLALRIGHCTLQGGYREENEDAVAAGEYPEQVVCLVADGMGGQGLGALAAQRAVATVLAELDKPARDRAGCATVEDALRHAFARANEEVLALPTPPGARGGSCLVVALWRRGTDVLRL